jgi:nucleoside-diphosphate-sugar epimerase
VDETTPDNPITVYDRHKLACEELLLEAGRSGLVRSIVLRLSNVYGHGVKSANENRGILNSMMRRAATGEPITVYGKGAYIRDFVHIDDVVEAFVRVMGIAGSVEAVRFLLASGEGRSLVEAFRLIAEETQALTGRTIEIRHVPEPADLHPIERRNFVGNSSLLRARTGWSPVTSFDAGIRASLKQILAEREEARRNLG